MIEGRILQRSGLLERRAVRAPAALRWQHWARALAARWARVAVSPVLGWTFRRRLALATSWHVSNRLEALIELSQSLHFDLPRGDLRRERSQPIYRRQLMLAPALAATRPRYRRLDQAKQGPRRQALIPATERLLLRVAERWRDGSRLVRLAAARAPRLVDATRAVRPSWLQAPGGVLRVEELPQRLLRRTERHIIDAIVAPRLFSKTPRSAAPQGVERAPEAAARLGARPSSFYESAPALSSPSAPSPSLDRIAEQVLERLDRRVIAQRERMGRI